MAGKRATSSTSSPWRLLPSPSELLASPSIDNPAGQRQDRFPVKVVDLSARDIVRRSACSNED